MQLAELSGLLLGMASSSDVIWIDRDAAGFCWGGSQTYRFATNRADLATAFVFYGRGPTSPDDIVATLELA